MVLSAHTSVPKYFQQLIDGLIDNADKGNHQKFIKT